MFKRLIILVDAHMWVGCPLTSHSFQCITRLPHRSWRSNTAAGTDHVFSKCVKHFRWPHKKKSKIHKSDSLGGHFHNLFFLSNTRELPIQAFTHDPIIPSEKDMLYMDKLHDTKKELQIAKTFLKLT